MNQAEYFLKNRYVAKYEFGERIFGYWNKIPFVGTIGNDTVINETIGPQLSIHLDLPICYENTIYNVIVAKHTDFKKISKLISLDEEINGKTTNRKTRS
jgi:hypothetical protein